MDTAVPRFLLTVNHPGITEPPNPKAYWEDGGGLSKQLESLGIRASRKAR